MKKVKLSDEEYKIITDYREGLKATSEDDATNNDSKKEVEDMKGNAKKGLKIAGIATFVTAVVGGIGYFVKKTFFDDPEGLDDSFDDEFEDEDSDDEDTGTGSDAGLDVLTEDTKKES